MNTIVPINESETLDGITNLLKTKHLSVTETRIKILSLFRNTKDALAHSDIETKTEDKIDRVTIYRTLQTFVDKGIIHTIPTTDNSVKYALCKDCTEENHHDNHVHFICSECNTITCLDNIVSPRVDLPENYIPTSVQVVINGKCSNCNE